ncbi:Gx transporter family protein, partial [Brachyspira pilosicoli]
MTLFEEIKTHTGKRRVYDIIFFAFLSSFIAAIENMFPRPIPYFRIGFSFIIILMVLDSFNLKELLLMIAIKNISVAIVFAYILTPPFYLGITGGIMSVIVMKLMRNFRNIFSLLGV